MSISVNFYNFSKQENSTKRPSGTGTAYSCNLKDSTSIENPVIELSDNPASFFNYAYISTFGRYYYVSDWTYYRGIWSAKLSVDVLATYKTQIGSSTVYVLRSSHSFDNEIKDTFYPLSSKVNKQVTSGTLMQWASGLAQGTYIAYINNGRFDEHNSYGSLNFMTFTPAQFQKLLTCLYPPTPQTWEDLMSSMPYNIFASALLNPVDYITKLLWIPLTVGTGQYPTNFGYYVANAGTTAEPDLVMHGILSSFKTSQTVNLTVPKRNDNNRGGWAEVEPFGKYYLYYGPFGIIPLDSTLLMHAISIDCTAQVDLMTGDLKLTVRTIGDYGSFKDVVFEGTANVGVEIPIDKAKSDGVRTFEALTGVVSTAIDAVTGNFVGAMSDVMGTIGTVTEAPPKASNVSKGLLSISDTIYLYHEYLDFVDTDNANKGRPLCQLKQISTIPGFILTNDGDISMPGTSEEKARVKTYLEGGFHYE